MFHETQTDLDMMVATEVGAVVHAVKVRGENFEQFLLVGVNRFKTDCFSVLYNFSS